MASASLAPETTPLATSPSKSPLASPEKTLPAISMPPAEEFPGISNPVLPTISNPVLPAIVAPAKLPVTFSSPVKLPEPEFPILGTEYETFEFNPHDFLGSTPSSPSKAPIVIIDD